MTYPAPDRSAAVWIEPNSEGSSSGHRWYAAAAVLNTVAAPSASRVSAAVSVASSAVRSTSGCAGPSPLRDTMRTVSPASASRSAVALAVAPLPTMT
ncbi:hypothetical protein [Actinomadura madurae]|uniref:hypothetical protein n=1 Tax=Actinomadura madurae TaxID=1993 RepID=UPI002026DE8A|nr:hypothetical protein [Actinomadura madurae]MCP9949201.1 hypothetical protein [Actinomadura madurae]MCP9965965.1 hypothetical protein [Actinomadura madurae]MCP9978445.1 hypothetical protein [Actinomadura madurae]URM94780.1 hypothetical protein LUW76_10840 [Actinomadura madurae]URN05487.1 hypothetical protein LUW74_20670 [Actinomadura madurae]